MGRYHVQIPAFLFWGILLRDDPSFPSGSARSLCLRKFGAPVWQVISPGRVNLIGEHVDYNDGLVLPVAIDRFLVLAARPLARGERRVVVYSQLHDQTHTVPLDRKINPGIQGWPAYVEGVLAEFQSAGVQLPGFSAVVTSDIPPGSGLASSAALTVALATLLESISGHRLDSRDKAMLCRKVEHRFAGVPCGMMDPLAVLSGQAGHALLLDCRSLQHQTVPLDGKEVALLVADSGVRHDLADGRYRLRREQSAEAARRLGLKSLRDVPCPLPQPEVSRLDTVLQRRVRHVTSEILRVEQAGQAMRSGNWTRLGQLMDASHDSLRDDYQVSCPELDALVGIVRGAGMQGGVYGSRMTGGGFGGCTVTLVDNQRQDQLADRLLVEYRRQTGLEARVFVCKAVSGCYSINLESGDRLS